jgi:hypothetical protein
VQPDRKDRRVFKAFRGIPDPKDRKVFRVLTARTATVLIYSVLTAVLPT